MPESCVLEKLADLLGQRNQIDNQIARLIDRPAHAGHLGEFIAAEIFDIELADSAVQKGSDGHFALGNLAGKSVNVKKYSLQEGLLDIRPDALPDFFLVLTGPRGQAASSRGTTQPWTIESVFLFEAEPLFEEVSRRGLKIGVATSVRRQYWDEAQIYPTQANQTLILTPDQKRLLALFAGETTRKGR